MKYFKIGILIVLIITLAGCFGPQRIKIIAKPVDKPVLILPEADVLYLDSVDWFILTPNDTEAAFETLRQQGLPIVFFGVSAEGYEDIAINFSDVRAYIQQQHAITKAYQNYYLESIKTIDTANSQIHKANQQVEKVNNEIIDKPAWYSYLNPFSTKKE